MTTMTVSRGDRSVTLDIYEQAGGLHIARDAGKPQAQVYRVSGEEPVPSDNRAPLEAFTVVGQLTGPGSYEDARALAEDIVRPHSGGKQATLDLSAVSGLGSYNVGFVGGGALKLDYPTNAGEWVSVQLSAQVVGNTIGGETPGEAGTAPPATSNPGPVELTNGTSTLLVEQDVGMRREVGRPDNVTRHDASDNPYLVDRRRAHNDVFELNGLWSTNAASKQNTLIESLVKPRLGQGSLELRYNGVYGLGTYNVVPIDSRATRVSWLAGEAGMVRLDTLKLTTVRSL